MPDRLLSASIGGLDNSGRDALESEARINCVHYASPRLIRDGVGGN